MPASFEQSYRLRCAFPEVLRAIPQKYPNEQAAHVVSVDTTDVSFDEEGRLRLERLIGVEQSAPAIILKLIGSEPRTFVREMSFCLPSPRPRLLQTSVNLSMSTILRCHESIVYMPDPDRPSASTVFQQLAIISAQGKLAAGQTWAAIGRRVEQGSVDRFASNAGAGRAGMESVLSRLYGSS